VQAYFREDQPPTLIVWGKNDTMFPAEGATPYKDDLPDAELHLLDTGHFALEDKANKMVALIREFLEGAVARGRATWSRDVPLLCSKEGLQINRHLK
jgi:pimeloyl-ACP methyl ester carboxylesterase